MNRPTADQIHAALAALREIGIDPYLTYAAAVALDARDQAREARAQIRAECNASDLTDADIPVIYGWRDQIAKETDPEIAYDEAQMLADAALQMGEVLGLTDE